MCETHKYFEALMLCKPGGALDQLFRWLVHLVLHYTDEAQLGQNSCLQLAPKALQPLLFHVGTIKLLVYRPFQEHTQ